MASKPIPVTLLQTRIATIVLTLLGVGYTVVALQLPLGSPVGSASGGVPLLIGVCWIVLGVALLLRKSELEPQAESEGDVEEGVDEPTEAVWPSGKGAKQMLFLLLLSGVYLVGLVYLGTITSSFLFLATISLLFGGKPVSSVVTSAALSFFIWLIFIYMLQMRLPSGVLL